MDHLVVGDDGGAVAVVDLTGKKTTLTPVFASAQGLAWSPDGAEIWFTAAEEGGNRALRAVTLSGRVRTLLTVAGSLTLQDVSRDGRLLATHDLVRIGLVTRGPADAKEKDLSWFDWSLFTDISEDGRTVVFTESGEAGGPGYSIYLRGTDGSPAIRLGEGQAFSLSPDGKRIFALLHPTGDRQPVIYPTGAGEAKSLPFPSLRVQSAAWLPDNRRFLMTAAEPQHGSRVYLGDAEGGAPKAVTPEGYQTQRGVGMVDAKRFLARGPDARLYVCSIEGGEPVAVPGSVPGDIPVGPGARDGSAWVRRGRGLPARVVGVDLASGKEEEPREFVPADPTGIVDLFGPRVTRDARYYVYSYARVLSDLYVVEGLK